MQFFVCIRQIGVSHHTSFACLPCAPSVFACMPYDHHHFSRRLPVRPRSQAQVTSKFNLVVLMFSLRGTIIWIFTLLMPKLERAFIVDSLEAGTTPIVQMRLIVAFYHSIRREFSNDNHVSNSRFNAYYHLCCLMLASDLAPTKPTATASESSAKLSASSSAHHVSFYEPSGHSATEGQPSHAQSGLDKPVPSSNRPSAGPARRRTHHWTEQSMLDLVASNDELRVANAQARKLRTCQIFVAFSTLRNTLFRVDYH